MKKDNISSKESHYKSNIKILILLIVLIILFGYTINHLLENSYEIRNEFYYGWIYSFISIMILLYFVFSQDKIHKKDLMDFHYLSVSLLSYIGLASLYFGLLLIINAPRFYESYDVIILGLFCLYMAYFLHKGKSNLGKDGLLLLYRAQWGTKLIEKVGTKYKKTLTFFSYVSIICGFVLMIGALYMLWMVIEVYLFRPDVVRAIKVPPITPLIPYLPKIFNIDFLPPLYVTYWIAMIAIVAIPHEFFHGIFMRRYNIHIKSTGFGFFPWFLPLFLAAFVEQDEKSMEKASKFQQMAVLSAGTFANVLTAIFFFFVFWGFFVLFFHPAGILINDYSASSVRISDITMVNGINVQDLTYDELFELMNNDPKQNRIETLDKKYYGVRSVFADSKEYVILYDDAPLLRNNLSNVITEINGNQIKSIEDLSSELDKYEPGEMIEVTSLNENKEKVVTDIVLDKHPISGKAFLGISNQVPQSTGLKRMIYEAITLFKKPNIYYEPIYDGLAIFIYNLLLWILLACVSVAFVNMLPVGIFDGGRFFYLTIWGITRSEKVARITFKIVTYLFLAFIALIMILWFVAIFGKNF